MIGDLAKFLPYRIDFEIKNFCSARKEFLFAILLLKNIGDSLAYPAVSLAAIYVLLLLHII